ncbi:MAG: hypothetical protein RIC55_24070 [Pirellulaceae bacterium]
MSIQSMVREAVSESINESNNEFTRLVGEHLAAGESLLGFQIGEKRLPFVVRILPLVPDVLTRPKRFMLAVTDRRILIVQVSKSLLTRKVSGRHAADVPLSDVQSIVPATGRLTSAVTIHTRQGRKLRYTGMLQPAAECFARDVQTIRQGCGGSAV